MSSRARASRGPFRALWQWLDSWRGAEGMDDEPGIDWLRVAPFVGLHLACFGVLLVGWSPFAVGVAAALYLARMFGITAAYHRLFAHRSYKASAPVRLFYLLFGAASVQNSALKWSSDHRLHHSRTDQDEDPYNIRRGFFWAHIGWIFYKDIDDQPLRSMGFAAILIVTLVFLFALPFAAF